MPRKISTTNAAAAPHDDQAADLVDQAADPIMLSAADRLALALEASADDQKAEVRVYKLGDDERFSWCETMTPEAYERTGYAALRTKWGAGSFKVVLYGTTAGKGGKPGFGLRAFELVTIAEDRTAPAPVAVQASSSIERTLEALTARVEQLARPTDPQVQMESTLRMVTLMREAFGSPAAAPAPRDSVVEILRTMRELRETGRDLFGDAAPEPADPLTSALPGLLELVKTGMQRQSADLVPAVSLPDGVAPPEKLQPNAATSQPTTAAGQVDDDQAQLLELRRKLGAVMALAEAGVAPDHGASIVYEHAPDEVLQLLADERWFDALCALEPRAAPHRDWLEKARTQVLAWVAEGGDQAGGGDDEKPAAPTPLKAV